MRILRLILTFVQNKKRFISSAETACLKTAPDFLTAIHTRPTTQKVRCTSSDTEQQKLAQSDRNKFFIGQPNETTSISKNFVLSVYFATASPICFLQFADLADQALRL